MAKKKPKQTEFNLTERQLDNFIKKTIEDYEAKKKEERLKPRDPISRLEEQEKIIKELKTIEQEKIDNRQTGFLLSSTIKELDKVFFSLKGKAERGEKINSQKINNLTRLGQGIENLKSLSRLLGLNSLVESELFHQKTGKILKK